MKSQDLAYSIEISDYIIPLILLQIRNPKQSYSHQGLLYSAYLEDIRLFRVVLLMLFLMLGF